MAENDPRDADKKNVPELVVPPRRASSRGMAAVVVPPPAAAPAEPAFVPQDFGMELERASASTPMSGPASSGGGGRELAIDVAGSDSFDLEIERGGSMTSGGPAYSPSAPASRPGAGSGLDVTYRRTDPKPEDDADDGEPSAVMRGLAFALPAVLFIGTLAGAAKLVHRRGRMLTTLLPHAFDASSTAQSGAVTGLALVFAIGVGVLGLRSRPRSFAMLASAGALILTSLAMVTVTLISTEEHPGPADGALLVPYLVPFALLMLGLGVAGRGRPLFLRGGASSAAALLAAIAGGAIAFVAIEISALAARLP